MNTSPASIAIVGSFPPPYGGVGIHVQRLCELLDQRGIDYVVYNATSDVGDGRRVIPVRRTRRTWLIRYLFTARERVIYMMSDRLVAWIVTALLGRWRRKRVLLRLRNAVLLDWTARSRWRKAMAAYALRRMDAVICVSRLLADTVASLGVEQNRIHWVPGFLPPSDPMAGREAVDPEVWQFIESHGPIISANGKIDWYNGVDLYGIDQCVELASRLKLDHPRVGIVFCFADSSPDDVACLDQLRRRATELGVEDNVFFNTQPAPFVPVLAESQLFVRPSNTDGDAISIREALFLGIATVASDAVQRPDGAVLFRTRDMDDFEAKVRAALGRDDAESTAASRLAHADKERIDSYLALVEQMTRLAETNPSVEAGDRNARRVAAGGGID